MEKAKIINEQCLCHDCGNDKICECPVMCVTENCIECHRADAIITFCHGWREKGEI